MSSIYTAFISPWNARSRRAQKNALWFWAFIYRNYRSCSRSFSWGRDACTRNRGKDYLFDALKTDWSWPDFSREIFWLLLGLLTLKDIAIDPLFFWAILGIILKLFSLLAVILFFTNLTSPLIAMFLTLATYIIGHSGYTMLDYALHRWDTNVLYFAKWILVLFPNLEALNLKNYIATDAPIELSKWLISYWAGTFYIVILLSIWAYIFSKKSFDNA